MPATLLVLSSLCVACARGADRSDAAAWEGTVDTLSTGQIVVRNEGRGTWTAPWSAEETLRLGSATGTGPETFGQIRSLDVDGAGRLWILDGQADEIRVFDASGEYVRTVGRKGSGPGEFAQPMRLDLGPDGRIWVMDPDNGRLSQFDTAGTYLAGLPAAGGFITLPWPGGFDDADRYYSPAPVFEPSFHMGLARFDTTYSPLDTLTPPEDPDTRPSFKIEEGGLTRVVASVPFTGQLLWRVSPQGTLWALVTGDYRLFELDAAGDTLRTAYRSYDPVPVTSADRAEAIEDLKWFTDLGGRIDLSLIPSVKPGASTFFIDDRGNLWVLPVTSGDDARQPWDIFDPTGIYLGRIELPFTMAASPLPRVEGDLLYGVVRDELDVPYVVVAHIRRPE